MQPFKVAMDYIDPSYHTWITGRSCRNLDGYLMTQAAVKEIYAHAAESADIAVIEGVRGLYEGYDGDLGSTAQIAKMLHVPVIFVVDARSITRSCAAIVKGYMDFDPQVQFKGVILNKVGSERHAQKAIKEIERYAGVEVVGVIRRNEEMHLAMRHLGLVPVLEGKTRHEGFPERVDKIRQIVEEGLNLDRILEIAKEAQPLPEVEPDLYRQNAYGKGLRIGVARDEAFNFYYRDNLELMELAGAEVVPFSPVHDAHLPDVDGIYIGGGYPELYCPGAVRECGHASGAGAGARERPAHLRGVRRADVPGAVRSSGTAKKERWWDWCQEKPGAARCEWSATCTGLSPAIVLWEKRARRSWGMSFTTQRC